MSVSSALETKGPVIILGDFKAHQEIVRDLLFYALTHSNFHVPSKRSVSQRVQDISFLRYIFLQ